MRTNIAFLLLASSSLIAMESQQNNDDILSQKFSLNEKNVGQELQEKSPYMAEKAGLLKRLNGEMSGEEICKAIKDAKDDTIHDLRKGGAPLPTIAAMEMMDPGYILDGILDKKNAERLQQACQKYW